MTITGVASGLTEICDVLVKHIFISKLAASYKQHS